MKNYSIIAGLACLAAIASCSPGASVRGIVAQAPGTVLTVEKLTTSGTELIDSVKTDANGAFTFRLDLKKGQPEFVYVYRGDVKLSSLLLSEGDKVSFEADTLGHWTVAGSPECELLRQVEADFSDFILKFVAAPTSAEMSKIYVDYYRSRIAYIFAHPYSLTVIPVLYQHINEATPVFSQSTDALYWRSAADSLQTVYPESKYVKAVGKEAARLENVLALNSALANAQEIGYPDIVMPDVNGESVALSGVGSKVVLLHFWNVADASAKLFNQDVLKPLYGKYHSRGLEIYAVGVSYDKAGWATIVKAQELPWINVCDGNGVESKVLSLYNVRELPTTLMIADGEISTPNIRGEAGLRKEIEKLLK